MASPAMHPARPSGLVDFRKHAEYPIVLGDSLKADSSSAEQFIDLRFNWQPKLGFKDFDSKLRSLDDGYKLTVNNTTSSDMAYRYAGHKRQLRSSGDEMQSFALVFDKKRSVFVLESIAHSIDLNLDAASSQSRDDIRRRPQLPKVSPESGKLSKKLQEQEDDDDDEPDPQNPFDFRNFLEEAKDAAEKATGDRSPMPGARTPMSGFASPAAGPTRFVPSVSQALPKEVTTPQSRPKMDQAKRKAKAAQDRKVARQPHQPLSSERISDSDDELSDAPVIKESKPSAPAPPKKGHSRNISANIGHSPHIVVNDGDLEIDMGSPPQEAKSRKRRIDAGAFRSHTGTPVLGQSPRIPPPHRQRDVEMKDVANQDEDEDEDVDELKLGSPRAQSGSRSNHGSIAHQQQQQQQQQQQHDSEHAPTPPNQNVSEEDDEVAELEDLLGGDDDPDTSATGLGLGLGLGIGIGISDTSANHPDDDDDSEVSEEE